MPLAEAATLDEASSGLAITFGFAVLVVFLVLAAQFESFVSALIVMATVPLGLACAVFALVLTGVSLNVYSQIGLVLLVGIMAKNGILIVEFANQLRDRGRSVRDADRGGTAHPPAARDDDDDRDRARRRAADLTPGGAGAEARHALGWIIVGGLGPRRSRPGRWRRPSRGAPWRGSARRRCGRRPSASRVAISASFAS